MRQRAKSKQLTNYFIEFELSQKEIGQKERE